jgi:hypothetical protein
LSRVVQRASFTIKTFWSLGRPLFFSFFFVLRRASSSFVDLRNIVYLKIIYYHFFVIDQSHRAPNKPLCNQAIVMHPPTSHCASSHRAPSHRAFFIYWGTCLPLDSSRWRVGEPRGTSSVNKQVHITDHSRMPMMTD